MKQLLQNLKNGEGAVADVPAPVVQRGRVLVRAAASLVSAGTERAVVELGRKSLLGKARERPDLVRKVVERVKSEGLAATLASVRDKLDESHALGYSAAGTVTEVGEGVEGFAVGDRVACAGAGYAVHAEVLSVPKNLCVRLPDEVDFESGAFATVGAIALQGVRLAEPTLGETCVVVGLGRVGAVGAVGMDVPRDVYFARELTLRVSMSYGPGRYDPEYEERGHDYPLPYVRWTEGRNLEAFLDLLAAGAVRTAPLVTHRFPVEDAARAYELISGDAREPYLAVLVNYDTAREIERNVRNPISNFKSG